NIGAVDQPIGIDVLAEIAGTDGTARLRFSLSNVRRIDKGIGVGIANEHTHGGGKISDVGIDVSDTGKLNVHILAGRHTYIHRALVRIWSSRNRAATRNTTTGHGVGKSEHYLVRVIRSTAATLNRVATGNIEIERAGGAVSH